MARTILNSSKIGTWRKSASTEEYRAKFDDESATDDWSVDAFAPLQATLPEPRRAKRRSQLFMCPIDSHAAET
jgi:hypothetical protein